jgi:hypothetical protein
MFDFKLTSDLSDLGGSVNRYNANIASLRILKTLEKENREATPVEQETLSRYVGWGDSRLIKRAFPNGSYSYSEPAKEIEELLSEDEIRLLRGSSLTAFYTSIPVIRAIYKALEHIGMSNLSNIRVLEPAAGVGHFIGAMPQSIRAKAQPAQELYPGIRILSTDINDFTKENRGETLSRIATGNWDLIIIPHSSFKLIPVSDCSFNKFVQEEIDWLIDYLADFKERNDKKESSSERRRSIKQIEKAIQKFESRLRIIDEGIKKGQ